MPVTKFTHLDTPRLRLRRFQPADQAAFMAYRNDPAIARYQSWVSISAADARDFIEEQQYLDPGRPGRWFQFAIEHKVTAELIGDCALHVRRHNQQGEIGYTLARAYHGRGLATEAVGAVLTYAFETLRLPFVTANLDTRNDRSAALLERLGFPQAARQVQRVWFKGEWTDEYTYSLTREDWLRARDEGLGARG